MIHTGVVVLGRGASKVARSGQAVLILDHVVNGVKLSPVRSLQLHCSNCFKSCTVSAGDGMCDRQLAVNDLEPNTIDKELKLALLNKPEIGSELGEYHVPCFKVAFTKVLLWMFLKTGNVQSV